MKIFWVLEITPKTGPILWQPQQKLLGLSQIGPVLGVFSMHFRVFC